MEHNERVRAEQRTRTFGARKSLKLAIIITAAIFFFEIAGGFISGSLALIADAGHMATDLFALLISFLAIRFSVQPSTKERSYGYFRLEILAALINGVVLCAVALFIVIEAWKRIAVPIDIAAIEMLAFGAVGLIANMVNAVFLQKEKDMSVNVRAAYIHILSDLAGSVGVVLGALLIRLTGWMVLDSLISLFIALLIVRSALTIIKEAVDVLMESVPKELDIENIEKTLLDFGHVKSLHDLHVWSLTSGINALSCHLQVDDLRMGQKLLRAVHRELKEKYNIDHVTIQLEEADHVQHFQT